MQAVWCDSRLIGKPVTIRHGPATVNAESWSATGHWGKPWEGCSGSMMRQSGNRPGTHKSFESASKGESMSISLPFISF